MPKNNLVDLWLKSKKVSKQDKQAIKKMSKEQIKVNFDNSLMAFGTAGIRAKMGPGTKQLNEFTYPQITIAYAKYIVKHFKNPSIVIGHDNRLNSIEYSYLCARVLSSFGIKVYLFNKNKLMPTPIISYVIRELKSSGGIIVTASHNPKEYNGFKAYNPDGGQILPDVANEIASYMPKPKEVLNITFKPIAKNILNINDKYIERYLSEAKQALVDQKIISEKKKFPIIFTGHHGTSCELLPKFLNSLGFNIIPVKEQCYEDPNFTNSPSSNPEAADSFNLAIQYAKRNKSKIIIGIDPDADRMAIMINKNNKWRLMTGNEMGIIYTWYVLNNKKFKKTPYVASSWVSNNLIDRICKKFKAKVYRTGTGFKWMGALVSQKLNKEDFVVAFEEAIGALNTTLNRDKDSFTASALALEIYTKYQKQNMDFVDILNKFIYPEYGYWYGETVAYSYANILDWKPVVQSKLDMLKKFKAKKIGKYQLKRVVWNKQGDCLDWILNGDSWIRFRVSGTEPKFKAYYNLYAKDQDTLDKQVKEVKEFISKILS